MTILDLSDLHYLKLEVNMLEEQIEILRAKAERTTMKVSNMPKGSKSVDYKDILVDTIQLLTEKQNAYNVRLFEIESYIAKIDDPFICAIIRLKFIKIKTWQQVANDMGGFNTADGLRIALKRFLEKQTKKATP